MRQWRIMIAEMLMGWALNLMPVSPERNELESLLAKYAMKFLLARQPSDERTAQ